MDDARSSHKRQRLSRNNDPAQLSCLPDTVLAEVATYLTTTTRALFATAMTADSSLWQECNWQRPPSSASRAIMGRDEALGGAGMWGELDFEDVPKSLRTQLSDGDLGGMLVCMDAVHTLRALKLTHCFGITGAGLEPLRGSSVLKRIDVSLVGLHESPAIDGDFALDEAAVIRILDSIIERNDSSLMHIQLPKRWREDQSDALNNLLGRYGNFLNSRRVGCQCRTWDPTNTNVLCGTPVQATEVTPWMISDANVGGIQDRTCFKCLKVVCDDCWGIGTCRGCEKTFCEECTDLVYCDGEDNCDKASCSRCKLAVIRECWSCDSRSCFDCRPMKECQFCGHIACEEFCTYSCDAEGCDTTCCQHCFDVDGKAVKWCPGCDDRFCFDCRVQKCRQEGDHISCRGCLNMIGPTLLSEYEELRRYRYGW